MERIEAIAKTKPRAVLLREKDLEEPDYLALAEKVLTVCRQYAVPCILHSFPGCAIRLQSDAIHMPLNLLRKMDGKARAQFRLLGTSCHSLKEAAEAERMGCTYLIAGHVFNTNCKKDVPPRGIPFLTELCREVSIPVYAIGGISHQNFAAVIKAGAKGACVMSGFMECDQVMEYTEGFKIE